MALLTDMSVRERNVWGNLFMHLVVGIYFYPKMFAVVALGDEAILQQMPVIIIKAVVLSIVLAVVVMIILAILKVKLAPEAKDERDGHFMAKSYQVAYGVLAVAVIVVIGWIIHGNIFGGSVIDVPRLSPLIISLWLFLALTLASLASALTQLFLYRRGY